MVARLMSDFKTFHITLKSKTPPVTRLEGAFLNYQQYLKTVFLTAFSPLPLPHRFLSRPRFSFRAAESLTLRTTKEKADQKIPPSPQAVVIPRVANSLSLFQTLIETTAIYFLPDIWRLFVLSVCSQGDNWQYISTRSLKTGLPEIWSHVRDIVGNLPSSGLTTFSLWLWAQNDLLELTEIS